METPAPNHDIPSEMVGDHSIWTYFAALLFLQWLSMRLPSALHRWTGKRLPETESSWLSMAINFIAILGLHIVRYTGLQIQLLGFDVTLYRSRIPNTCKDMIDLAGIEGAQRLWPCQRDLVAAYFSDSPETALVDLRPLWDRLECAQIAIMSCVTLVAWPIVYCVVPDCVKYPRTAKKDHVEQQRGLEMSGEEQIVGGKVVDVDLKMEWRGRERNP